MARNTGEPSTAPQEERWYNLSLGSSLKDQSSTKFCTLRYEFKPASIDKSQAGSLHKNKENRVTVEFHNNQPGKPKVSFEGSSEDYKDNDGVLFFDGQTFRLERLHRAVKRLRHVRLPGESVTAAATTVASSASSAGIESRSSPPVKIAKPQTISKPLSHSVPLEIERIDIGEPESPGPKSTSRNSEYNSLPTNSVSIPSDPKFYEPDENVDIEVEDDVGSPDRSNAGLHAAIFGFEFDNPNENNSDDEIADVDISEDEGNKGPTAAEVLHAQVNAEEQQQQQQQQQQQTSSSSDSSDSGSSGSGSGSGSSSSSDSDGSDNDSASSGGEVDLLT